LLATVNAKYLWNESQFQIFYNYKTVTFDEIRGCCNRIVITL
jgi:hypothetical protein